MKAWHFTDGDRLRDGRPVPPVGEWLEHHDRVVPCESGLHASVRLIDALLYAPGAMLHRVDLGGEIVHHGNKHVASRRRIRWSLDAGDVLRRFARREALDVAHMWNAPGVVLQYLRTGDETIRNAAYDAAYAAAYAAYAAYAAAYAVHAAYAAVHAAANAAAYAVHAAVHASPDAYKRRQNRRLTAMVMAEYRKQRATVAREGE